MEIDSITVLNNLIGKWVSAIGLSTVIVVGIVGNILSYVVYSRKTFSKTSCGFYFRALSISDSVYLLIMILEFMAAGLEIDLRNYSDLSCKIIWFALYIPPTVSSWFEALVSFDRMINIVAPSKMMFLRTRKVTILLVIAVICIQTSIYTPVLYFYQLIVDFNSSGLAIGSTNGSSISYLNFSDSITCASASSTYANILSLYDLIYSTLTPFVVMSISTIVILVKVFKSRHKITSRGRKSRRDNKDIQFTITSVSLCLLFFVLNIGITTFMLLASFNLVAYQDFQLLLSIVCVFFLMDYSLKFYVYFLVNHNFRAEFKSMVLSIFSNSLSNNPIIERLKANSSGSKKRSEILNKDRA